MELVWFVPKLKWNEERRQDEIGKVYPYDDPPLYTWHKYAIIPSSAGDAVEFAQSTRYAPASKELYTALTMAQEWINNIVDAIGMDQAIDSMPNNCRGRLQIKAALENAERLDLLEKKSKRGSPVGSPGFKRFLGIVIPNITLVC